jgi:hypothetical protein
MSTETSIASGAETAFDYADALPVIAITSTALAMTLIPAAGLCLVAMLDGAALPSGLGKAAAVWAETGAKIDEGAQKLREVVESIPEDAWSADDRKAFESKVEELRTQLETGRVFADSVGAILVICGTVIALYDLFIMAVGILLMFEFTALAATIASIVGNLGASEAEEAADNASAAAIAADIQSTNEMMQTISQVCAGVLVAALALFEGIELFEGNTNVGTDIFKGTVVASPEIALALLTGAAGRAEGLENAGAHAAPGLLSKVPGLDALAEGLGKIAPGKLGGKALETVADYVLPGAGKHAVNAMDPVLRDGVTKIADKLGDLLGDRGAEVPAGSGSKKIGKSLDG